jgi:hypothetical protein
MPGLPPVPGAVGQICPTFAHCIPGLCCARQTLQRPCRSHRRRWLYGVKVKLTIDLASGGKVLVSGRTQSVVTHADELVIALGRGGDFFSKVLAQEGQRKRREGFLRALPFVFLRSPLNAKSTVVELIDLASRIIILIFR